MAEETNIVLKAGQVWKTKYRINYTIIDIIDEESLSYYCPASDKIWHTSKESFRSAIVEHLYN